jgi:23S rRNA G2069 N7-methylase RlmK/C1962 C5-methylase RlmI
MKRALRTPQRYQLTKHSLAIVEAGHPWIFRDQLSSAAQALADGQWVALYGPDNRVVAHGIYQAEGAVGIRVLTRGPDRPTAASLAGVVDAAVAKRAPLAAETDAARLIHGENDGLPGVVIDRFADTLVVQAYAPGTRALARWCAGRICARGPNGERSETNREGAIPALPAGRGRSPLGIVEKPPKRGKGGGEHVRALRGPVPEVVRFREGALTLAASPAAGQKSGTFLDLRGLRRELAARDLAGARVLDLFAYTGGLGLACERAGATSITHVDASEAALLFGEAHHTLDPARHTWIEADVFEWLPAHDRAERYDVVICDPPSMTSSMDQLPRVIAAYERMYRAAKGHVTDGGLLVACCCTSRVARGLFRKTVGDALGRGFALEKELTPEVDHPVAFPQADYLKILLFRSRRAPGGGVAGPAIDGQGTSR